MSYSTLTFSCLFLSVSARVVWLPEEFDPHAVAGLLAARAPATCGGLASWQQCAGDVPADFCCPTSTKCMKLNSASAAVLCCPEGQDCGTIAPISCDQSAQNATQAPSNMLHADPTLALDPCGSDCCPMGYSCRASVCILQPVTTSVAPSTSTAAGTASSTAHSSTTSTEAPAATSDTEDSSAGPDAHSSGPQFSGKSFAAGLLPGIALGAIIVAAIFVLLSRRKRKDSNSYVDNEKRNGKHRDTLTNLDPWRPTITHGRSISEPVADPSISHRTDFLRTTPPRPYPVDAQSPVLGLVTPTSRETNQVRPLFSRSPFNFQTPWNSEPVQTPVPSHIKRGTLSFHISPIRALKKQKSMHSLRRHVANASPRALANNSNNNRSNSQRHREDLSRSNSTETIQVLMPSHEHYAPEPTSHTSWSSHTADDDTDQRTPYASSSRYPTGLYTSTQPQIAELYTPTPQPIANRGGAKPPLPSLPSSPAPANRLGSPYAPHSSSHGNPTTAGGRAGGNAPGPPPQVFLRIPTAPLDGDAGGNANRGNRRDTTFSGLMERAGLRKSELVVGKGAGRGRR